MQLEPKKIRVDGGTQPRAELSIPVMEQYADNRLIRPTSRYIGKWDLKVQPIEERP